jgi:hypothetical protein
MENRPNLTHKELREYLLAFFCYSIREMEKIISSLCKEGEETKLSSEIPIPLFQFMADTVAKHMLTGNEDAPVILKEDRDGLVKTFYQCMNIKAEMLDEEEKKYLEAVIDQFLEKEISGESLSSLNCGQAWSMVEASVQTSGINGVPLNDPLSLQSGWNEAIRIKYPTKDLYIKASERNALNTAKSPHSFSIHMKVIEIIAKRAYGE